ncbi:DUF3298 and DUF4163 domain-containing protein [Oceanobacillus sp. Castelsardo]|uniref:DUF3298 and DUF4163 domain-containing protein n=1 Tax=Oceanobacillus sp. Castelsardo TaxID=1851204 RepID=UPI0009EDB1C1|nr:DUF3298 and DUF4163 domain-containing protein [Oceanobacillus sp. Castelsardo]
MPIPLPVNVRPYKIQDGPKIQVIYPQVDYPRDRNFEYLMNQTFVQETQKLINEQVEEMSTKVVEMDGAFEIKNNQRNVLSITLSNYTYHHQAANGLTLLRSVTFDLEKKKRCNLKDLFKPGSDYINKLSKIIHKQIKERDIPIITEFTKIEPNQYFYIADKTLVIYFQQIELTPHYFGFPMFPISVYDIQDIIDENGPLGRMATNS